MACARLVAFPALQLCSRPPNRQGRTPAMAAGLADHRWTIEEIVMLIEPEEGTENSQNSN